MKLTGYYWNGSIGRVFHGTGVDFDPSAVDVWWDWSDTNLPWQYTEATKLNDFKEGWPVSTVIVPISTASSDFYTNLAATISGASAYASRIVVQLGEAVYHLNQFRLIGSSGSPTYSFGFWFPQLQGFLGEGPDKTFIQLDANSMSAAQTSAIAAMTKASGTVNQMGLCRMDGTPTSLVLNGGLTFQAADQNLIAAFAADNGIAGNQPAPHHGVVLYENSQNLGAIFNNVRFRAAGRACTSLPPFEHANVGSQYGNVIFRRCEFDGRRAPELDSNRPRRCGPVMGNNETSWTLDNCWVHHTNISRIAINDQNKVTAGAYTIRYCKVEQISNVQNKDPNLNGGASLGGYTNASLMGWENCEGTITVHHCILSQDNPYTDIQTAQHFQFTAVSGGVHNNPAGGRFFAYDNIYINTAWPALNGIPGVRCPTTSHWYTDGLDVTMDIRLTQSDPKLPSYWWSAAWPPNATTLASAGITANPPNRFIVKGN